MEALADILSFMAGTPALVGLVLAAVTIFLTSDWRLSLTALLVQYLLVGVTVSRFVQLEVALVKILVGVLAVSILYLSARHLQELRDRQQPEAASEPLFGVHLAWGSGPLSLPLRLLVVLLLTLVAVRFFGEYRSLLPSLGPEGLTFPPDIAFVSLWLGIMGLVGLVLSGEPMRVAPALFTVMAAFDLIFACLESNLAVVGFLGALMLLVALAFSYLATAESLGTGAEPQETGLSSADVPEENVGP